MRKTPNFGLNLPDGTDKVDISVLNENSEIIDTALASGGGGVQSDYAVSDSASAAYIKNRPFYETVIDTPDTTLNGDIEREVDRSSEQQAQYSYPYVLGLELGTTYTVQITTPDTVLFDGELECIDIESGILGFMYQGETLLFMLGDNVESHTVVVLASTDVLDIDTVSVTIKGVPFNHNVIKKLDSKYINFNDFYTPSWSDEDKLVGKFFDEDLYEHCEKQEITSAESSIYAVPYLSKPFIDTIILQKYSRDTLVAAYQPFYSSATNFFSAQIDTDSIVPNMVSVRIGEDIWDSSYRWEIYIKLKYTRDNVMPRINTIELPADDEYDSPGNPHSFAKSFGNITDADLDLVLNQSYTMSMRAMGQTVTHTATCGTWHTGGVGGNDFNYIDGTESLAHLKIFANAMWDYDNLDENDEPALIPSESGGYCFEIDKLSDGFTATVNVTAN